MQLQRQGGGGEQGYAMAALLVMLSMMAIMMTVAMPVWRQQAQREKEEELVWRGQQYVRAIRLYQAKNQSFPPSLDLLVDGRYIRKKYKDPITNEDFLPLGAAAAAGLATQASLPAGVRADLGRPTQPGQQGGSVPGQQGGIVPGQQGGTVPGQQGGTVPGQQGGTFPGQQGAFPGGPPVGGVIGVASKSKAESIRMYQGRTHYNEWAFVFVNTAPGGPGGVPGSALPGLPGGRGGQGQPGAPGSPRRGQPGTGPRSGGPIIPSIEGGRGPTPFPGGRGRGGF
jgi:type II secretory pathway pseudopilin PulG